MPDWNIEDALTILIYGDPGSGRTGVAMTAPAPILMLDSEGGSKMIRRPRVYWSPMTEAPPAPGDWDVCIVHVTSWAQVEKAIEWLRDGDHPFRSVVLDSLTETQKHAKAGIAGEGQMTEQRWGQLLAKMEDHVRALRDLTVSESPVQCVAITAAAMTEGEGRRSKEWPYVQGGLRASLPTYVDVVGYVYPDDDNDGLSSMLVRGDDEFVAKDRTAMLPGGGITGRYGTVVQGGKIDLATMIETIYSEDE